MERESCTGTRKGKECGGALFKCGHCGGLGCEKSGCDNRQFKPIERCQDCGRSYERIKQFKPSAAPHDGAGSNVAGRPMKLPQVEVLFAGVLVLAILLAAVVGLSGVAGPRPGAATTPAASIAIEPVAYAYTDICQCYREGSRLAGQGYSVLSSEYRTHFVQCRAVFGPDGGEAWTAGWNARMEGRLIGAGCRSWQRGLGR